MATDQERVGIAYGRGHVAGDTPAFEVGVCGGGVFAPGHFSSPSPVEDSPLGTPGKIIWPVGYEFVVTTPARIPGGPGPEGADRVRSHPVHMAGLAGQTYWVAVGCRGLKSCESDLVETLGRVTMSAPGLVQPLTLILGVHGEGVGGVLPLPVNRFLGLECSAGWGEGRWTEGPPQKQEENGAFSDHDRPFAGVSRPGQSS